MSELEMSKNQILKQLRHLCAHCSSGQPHNCPIKGIAARVQAIRGVPLIVNNEFRGVVWSKFQAN
jgi:hypothetical protein